MGMAAAAETIDFEARTLQSEAVFLSVDLNPELNQVRSEARQEAYGIIEQNRQLLISGEFESVPIDVDALGTAQKVIEAEKLFGINSWQYQDSRAGLNLDCQRLYAEAVRKNTYEYFPFVRQEFNHQTGEYFSHGQSIMAITEKGLSPIVEKEETERRVNERVEEATYRAIGRAGLSQAVSLLTISECTDWSIAEMQRGSNSGHGGYVPEIEKLMIRNVTFDQSTSDRFEEQVGLPGKFITHEVVLEALNRRGVSGLNNKSEVHGTQLIHDQDIFEFVALLDEIASEKAGLEIFMGEVLAAGQFKNYNLIRQEAFKRQSELTDYSEQLAEYILDLESNQTDRWLAVKLVEKEVKKKLIKLADLNNQIAVNIFDEQTAQGLREVAYLRSIGQIEAAQTRLDQVEQAAPAPSFCGAGSCGLEDISSGSDEAKKMKKMGLDPKDALKDTERKCKDCGRQKVVYDQTNKMKGCVGCGATKGY